MRTLRLNMEKKVSEIDDPTNSPRITPDLGLTKTGGADSFSFLEKLRIPNGDLEPLQTQKVVSAVYGSKPHKDAFFRTHPGPLDCGSMSAPRAISRISRCRTADRSGRPGANGTPRGLL